MIGNKYMNSSREENAYVWCKREELFRLRNMHIVCIGRKKLQVLVIVTHATYVDKVK